MAKKASQGTQTKVETLTIRVTPRMKFGLELLSRKQHRSLTSVAEWALEKALKDEDEGLYHRICGANEYLLDRVWDPYEPDRFINMAIYCPHLLSYEDELLWKLIRENGYLWKGQYQNGEWVWVCDIESIIIERVREYWDKFKRVAEGDLLPDALPTWSKTEETKLDILTDDDIPF